MKRILSDSPKVSIITVVYNDSERVLTTLKSVSKQTYPYIEYIVIDGNSNDNTLEVIKESNVKIDILISEPDKGIYDAMNKGCKYTSGEFIMFLNAGDTLFSNDTIKEILDFDKSKDCDVIYGKYMNDYVTFKKEINPMPIGKMYKTMPFCHQATLTKREWLIKYPFNLKYRLIADYDFFRKIYKNGAHYLFRPIVISNYLCTGGASADNLLKVYKENFYITKDINVILRSYWLIKKVFNYYLSLFTKFILPESTVNWIKKLKSK
ncbi:glycosyltransferase family 2 protein [Carboxylicivirga linearis]|uniref:Glycosyltransferase n=1 Tax=Carboxylicivirga linearis TaxID=1628157 RepID=A0ABS5JQF0_9BACT|nr:glycosyltransferase family 2 protein [Carboxylicivirga linearis]MBS2097105.1 glycosyltransferase [Carboxylicivirga linearis]